MAKTKDNTTETPPRPPVDGFDERLLLHTDNGVRGRVSWFFTAQSILVVALTNVWLSDLGVATVCAIGVILTASMAYMIVRLAYALQNIQKWVEAGTVFANRTKLYAEFSALGKTNIFKQWRALEGSKSVYAKWTPCIVGLLWLIVGASATVSWARAAGLLP